MALLVIFMAFQKELIKKNKQCIVLLLSTLVFAGYLALGGAIFKKLEGPQEEIGHNALTNIIESVKTKYSGIPDSAINDLFNQLSANGVKGLPDNGKHIPKWTFGNAVFYSVTLLTTIGYGHLSPWTDWGKVATIVYTGVGIPATLYIMSLYVCRLMALSACYKASLFRRLKGPFTAVQVNFIHITTIMTLIFLGCFIIPAVVFNYLEDSWTYLDALYYCFISLTTVGLGDFVPGTNSQQPYVDLYRVCSAVFILYGVIVMMFMLTLSSDFCKHYYEEIPITMHTDKSSINPSQHQSYGSIVIHTVKNTQDDQQKLLQP